MRNQARRSETLRFHKRQLLRVLQHIREHLDEELRLEELASLACLSPFHFHRVFRGMTGEALGAHVRRIRLERAAACLRAGRRPVVDIALEAGFDSHEAFTRAFRAAYGRSPTQFRSGTSSPQLLHAPSGVHYEPGVTLGDFRVQQKGIKDMKIEVITISPMRVAFVRHVGPYGKCGAAWDKLTGYLGREGFIGPGCRFLGVSYDDPEDTPSEQLRYDACVTVGPDFQPAEGVGVMEIAGGEYARVTHRGPHARLGHTYGWIMGQWMPRQARTLRNTPCFEEYFNSLENTAPEDLLTDVHVPLDPVEAKP